MKNENINSCVYALIQLSGHSPKTVELGLGETNLQQMKFSLSLSLSHLTLHMLISLLQSVINNFIPRPTHWVIHSLSQSSFNQPFAQSANLSRPSNSSLSRPLPFIHCLSHSLTYSVIHSLLIVINSFTQPTSTHPFPEHSLSHPLLHSTAMHSFIQSSTPTQPSISFHSLTHPTSHWASHPLLSHPLPHSTHHPLAWQHTTWTIHSLTQPFTPSLSHTLSHSITQSLTHLSTSTLIYPLPLNHPLLYLAIHSLGHLLPHSAIYSHTQPSYCYTDSVTHFLTAIYPLTSY